MSQMPPATFSASGSPGPADSPSASEKSARSTGSGSVPIPASEPVPVAASASTPAPAPKLRSCVVCRSRKVRCDKLSPCSTCRRANIACVFPSGDRPPRWARRLERVTNQAVLSSKTVPEADTAVDQVMGRLRSLESLVKDLTSQLDQANAAAHSSRGGSSDINSPGNSSNDYDADHQTDTASTASTTGLQKQFGRLVLQDTNQSRYVSSGFWSRVNDEIDELKKDTLGLASGESGTSEDDDSPGKTLSTQELERTPSERHAFLFQHNLGPSGPNIRGLYPLPSQIPFLLNAYAENVNFFFQIVHIPTVTKMIRDLRGSDLTSLTPANEALMFSIYYSAVTSMEEDDVMADFGCTKAELNLKYRLGLEYSLAKADFLNAPDIVLVQAFVNFLLLVRRHDSPRFVWMMTGLVIRMAQALGLQRDGSHFDHLTPFEIEMRRRVWWAVCVLDVRSSEDQGMDLTITTGSFDTKLPLNLNDADIEPDTKETPIERQNIADMTFSIISYEICIIVRRLMAGLGRGDQSRLLNEIFEKLDQAYLQHSTEAGNIAYWVAVTSTRLVMAKMTLLIYLPILFSSPNEQLSDGLRTKLLISAIEVAEYNHSLNSEEACRRWRWLFQTYTHWHSTVYILIEISRRPWSSIVERAWVALHSKWLIPAQSKTNKNMRIWFPLRNLMAKARKHREAELDRLRGDIRAAVQLEIDDSKLPLPASSGPFPAGNSSDIFRERWRKLVGITNEAQLRILPGETPATAAATPSTVLPTGNAIQQGFDSVLMYGGDDSLSDLNFGSASLTGQDLTNPTANTNTTSSSGVTTNSHNGMPQMQTENPAYYAPPAVPFDWPGGAPIDSDTLPWLWNETDPSMDVSTDMDIKMDLDTEVNWYNWVESVKGME